MRTSVTVDTHPKPDRRVLVGAGEVVLAIFDGDGSWENGAEAAAWVKEHLARVLSNESARLKRCGRLDTELLKRELGEIGAALRKTPTADGPDVAFDFFMVVHRETSCELLALGSYGCRLVRGGHEYPIVEALMLVDQAVAEGKLSVSDAVTFPHPEICVGPYFGGSHVTNEGDALLALDLALLPDDRLLVAREHVLRLAAGRGALSSVRTAPELHDLAARGDGIAAVLDFVDLAGGRSLA